jgi:phosphate transport system protein
MIQLAQIVETTITNTWTALESLDNQLASEIYHGNQNINAMVRECMKKDLTISLMQTPVATDWRHLMATQKILYDIERITDNCADICHYIFHLTKEGGVVTPPSGLQEMYRVMASMVVDVLRLYNEGDVKDIDEIDLICDKDDIVDMAFTKSMEEISQKMVQEPNHVRQYISYVLIVKYIERMADHASNITDWILYRSNNTLK